MALINCSECGKKISEKASSCPNCGNPNVQIDKISKIKEEELLKFPELPKSLKIGKQIVNWGGNASVKGIYSQEENIITEIPSGKVHVILHTHGIEIIKGLTFYPIHNSQIINMEQTPIGGMSGTSNQRKAKNRHYLVINFWDIKTKIAQTILINGNGTSICAFVRKHAEEKSINKTENRLAENDNRLTLGVLAILVIIVYIFILIII